LTASTVLVQGSMRPDPQTATGIITVESSLHRIVMHKAEDTARHSFESVFGFDVEMTELARGDCSLSLAFVFTFGRKYPGQTCRMEGRAELHFAPGAGSEMRQFGDEVDTDMAVQIFRNHYETIYLLHDALGIEAPSPWIVKDASVS
jgi:hypothetical protein